MHHFTLEPAWAPDYIVRCAVQQNSATRIPGWNGADDGLQLSTGEALMSQKPRTGGPTRGASVTRQIVTEGEAKAAPSDVVPVAEPTESVEPPVEAGLAEPEFAAAVEAVPDAPATPDPVELTAEPIAPEPAAEPIVPEPIVPEPIAAAVPAVIAEATPMAADKPTNPTLNQGMKTMMKSTEDFVAFSQANLEAFVKSGQIWSAGMQELTKQFASSAKASFDESVSTFKAISTAKSVKEAMDLQSTFAKATIEKAMAESNKLTDASIKLTEQTLAPITERVTLAVETFGKAN